MTEKKDVALIGAGSLLHNLHFNFATEMELHSRVKPERSGGFAVFVTCNVKLYWKLNNKDYIGN